jgi:hypothetical protein
VNYPVRVAVHEGPKVPQTESHTYLHPFVRLRMSAGHGADDWSIRFGTFGPWLDGRPLLLFILGCRGVARRIRGVRGVWIGMSSASAGRLGVVVDPGHWGPNQAPRETPVRVPAPLRPYVADPATKAILSLPAHPHTDEAQQQYLTESLRRTS